MRSYSVCFSKKKFDLKKLNVNGFSVFALATGLTNYKIVFGVES